MTGNCDESGAILSLQYYYVEFSSEIFWKEDGYVAKKRKERQWCGKKREERSVAGEGNGWECSGKERSVTEERSC